MSYSYSRLATFSQCPYKHKLIYIDGNYINVGTIATDFGTLIHSIEEDIGNTLKEHRTIDYPKLEYKLSTNINKIKSDYLNQFYEPDKVGRTYDGKYHFYIRKGIYRLEHRIKKDPSLEILGLEEEFFVTYRNIQFHGFIDRLLKKDDTYIIEDVKTYTKPLEDRDLKNPLQFVIYALAIREKYKTTKIKCAYDLPLCDLIQEVNSDFMVKGLKELDKLIDSIEKGEFKPKPSPLCHWCIFSKTYPDQPEEAKNLCPYYSLWTKSNKTKECHKYWMGEDNHKIILEQFRKENNGY